MQELLNTLRKISVPFDAKTGGVYCDIAREYKTYYFTLELAKQFGGDILFLVSGIKGTDNFKIHYTLLQLCNGLYLDMFGYLRDLNEREPLLSELGFSKLTCVSLSLTVDGAKKVLKDNGYTYNNTILKQYCRYFIRNHCPVMLIKNIDNAGYKFTSTVSLKIPDGLSEFDRESGEYSKAGVLYFLPYDNAGNYEFVDENAFLNLQYLYKYYCGEVGWIPNYNWYDRWRHKKYKK